MVQIKKYRADSLLCIFLCNDSLLFIIQESITKFRQNAFGENLIQFFSCGHILFSRRIDYCKISISAKEGRK